MNTSLDAEVTNSTVPSMSSFCNLKAFGELYEPVHGYLALSICIVGIIFNIINVLVLTHRDMRRNPINLILTGIAVADLLMMLEYIPFAAHMYLLKYQGSRTHEEEYSRAWGLFMLFHSNFSIHIHTVSIWYTLQLAVWRLITIKSVSAAAAYCSSPRCHSLLLLGYFVPLVLTLPNFLATQVAPRPHTYNGTNITLHVLQWSSLGLAHDGLLYKLNFWFYGAILKLLPCALLIIITCFLIRALYQFSTPGGGLAGLLSKQAISRKRRMDRTTRLLIIILILFVLSEMPQGVITLMAAVLGTDFFEKCYTPLGEVMDLVALVNCTVNFLLYSLMSRQFRITFRKTFHLREARKGSDASLARDKKGSPSQLPPKAEYSMVPLQGMLREGYRTTTTSFRVEQTIL